MELSYITVKRFRLLQPYSGGHKQKKEMKWKLEMEIGNGNGNAWKQETHLQYFLQSFIVNAPKGMDICIHTKKEICTREIQQRLCTEHVFNSGSLHAHT